MRGHTVQCFDCKEQFSAIADGEITSLARDHLDTHFASCNACRTEFEHFRQAMDALRTSQLIKASPDFQERVVETATSRIEREALLENASGEVLETSPRGVSDHPTLPTPTGSGRAALSAFPVLRWAAAAALLLAFGVILLQEMRIRDGEHRFDEIAGNFDRLAAEYDLEGQLRKMGLERVGDQWLPKEIADGGAPGQAWFRGEWRDAGDVAEQLGYRLDPLTDWELKALAEKYIEIEGYEKIEGRWIHRGDIARFGKGMVETTPGVWKPVSEMVDAWHRDQGHVYVDGTWLPPDHREAARASLAIDSKAVGDDPHAVTQQLARMHLGAGVRFRGLTLYPLLAPRQTDAADVTMLHRAGMDVAIAETADPFAVEVTNRGAGDVFLMPGDLLSGGRFDRVVASAQIVPAGTTATVAVYSADTGTFRAGDAFDARSGHDLAPLLVRKALGSELGQGAVWGAGGEYARLTQRRLTVALQDLYEDEKLESAWIDYDVAYFGMPAADDEMVGLVVGVGDEIVCAEWFSSHRLLRENFDRMVRSSALEAVRQEQGAYWNSTYPNSVDGARNFLENVTRSDLVRRDGASEAVLEYGNHVLGTAALHRGVSDEPAHVIIFDPTMDVVDLAMEWSMYDAEGAQAAQLLSALRGRIQRSASEGERLSIFRELASMRAADVARVCVSYLNDSNPRIQSEAIRALEKLHEPEAIVELMRWFEVNASRELAALAEAAAVLATVGGEEALHWMIATIPRTIPAAAAVLVGALPTSVFSVAREDLAVAAAQAIVDFWGRAGDDARAKDALSRLTGRTFASHGEAEAWLKIEANRDEFRRAFGTGHDRESHAIPED